MAGVRGYVLRQDHWRTKAPFLAWVRPVCLDQHRVVHVLSERGFDCLDVWAVPVRGDLDAIAQARPEIGNEGRRVRSITPTDEPRRDDLGIGVERDPSPHVAEPEFARLSSGTLRALA